jgi:type IV pilus assembly protein PilX
MHTWFLSRKNSSIARQEGSVLIVSLIMLLLLTLVAVAGMQGTILQERMTGNLRDRDLAFQAAEAALREAEAFIRNNPTPTTIYDNSNGLYQVNATNTPDWSTRNTTDGNGFRTYAGNFPGVAAQPQYYIEEISTVQPAGTETEAGTAAPPPPFFRITALGTGGSASTQVVLTSVYRTQ